MGAFDQTLLLRRLRTDYPASPADPGARVTPGREPLLGWNPYRQLPFRRRAIPTDNAVEILIANENRAYLIIQNQGPGNVYLQFGSSADAGSFLMVPTQTYELIGGGPNGSYVPPDSVWLLADAADTFATAAEGIWLRLGSES